MIEKALSELTHALNKHTAAIADLTRCLPQSTASVDTEIPEPEPEKTPAKKPRKESKITGDNGAVDPMTLDEVRAAITEVAAIDKTHAKKMIKEHGGAARLGDVDPDRYLALYSAAKEYAEQNAEA